jgi:flotillin
MFGSYSGLVIGGGVVFVVLFFCILFWVAGRYRKAGPNEAIVVFGRGRTTVVVGGGIFVWPFFYETRRMSLEIMTIDVNVGEVYTDQGVPVTVDGVAQVRVGETEEMVRTAAGQFLGKTVQEVRNVALQTLEGHLRAILGMMTVEAIYKQRDQFAQQVQDVAANDLAGMGMRIVSFTIREIRDSQGYLEALGKKRTAEVKRDAIIGERTADREARAEAAQQDMEARQAEAARDADARMAERDRNIRAAEYQAQENEAKAKADLAYPLQESKTQQLVEKEKIQVEVIQKEMQTQVQVREIERKERELDATVRKPAEADRFRIETLADAERARRIQEAEGEATATTRLGQGRAAATQAEGLAQAEVIKATGLSEAEVIRQKGFSEAEAMSKKAEAWQNYNEAAITEKVIEVLPAIASAVAQPLAKTEKIVMVNVGGGDGAGGSVGASRITGDVANVISQLPPVVEALSGIDFTEMLQRLPDIRRAGAAAAQPPADKPSTPPQS